MSIKYAVIIPDGCADWPIESLGGKTPMQVAKMPNLDALAQIGLIGESKNVPDSLSPGSDVATLGLLGYDPLEVFTGRAPLEAAAQGIELAPDDWAFRCNLVTIANGIMRSFTAGHITTPEAAEILKTLQQELAPKSRNQIKFYTSVSYRNLMVFSDMQGEEAAFSKETTTFAPHDYTDQSIINGLPNGRGSDLLLSLMSASREILRNHPVNEARIAAGKLPVTQIWLWGQGRKPNMPTFAERFKENVDGKKIKGAMITAVDLLRGIAKLIGWDIIDVPGITGYVDTDYAAKGKYAAEALEKYDIVCVHVEAPDEAGHEGALEKKIKSLEE
ncbi:MAG: cofactor-independent phosphoglycerate mutase, partial [Thermoguttaceae bacterium]